MVYTCSHRPELCHSSDQISSGTCTDVDLDLDWCRPAPAVRLTCIACFSPISQSILNRFWCNLARTIFESRGDYREIFIKKYYIVEKLDDLTCSKFVITTSVYKPFKLVKLTLNLVPCKFHENRLRIDWEISEKHAIQFNLTAGIVMAYARYIYLSWHAKQQYLPTREVGSYSYLTLYSTPNPGQGEPVF